MSKTFLTLTAFLCVFFLFSCDEPIVGENNDFIKKANSSSSLNLSASTEGKVISTFNEPATARPITIPIENKVCVVKSIQTLSPREGEDGVSFAEVMEISVDISSKLDISVLDSIFIVHGSDLVALDSVYRRCTIKGFSKKAIDDFVKSQRRESVDMKKLVFRSYYGTSLIKYKGLLSDLYNKHKDSERIFFEVSNGDAVNAIAFKTAIVEAFVLRE